MQFGDVLFSLREHEFVPMHEILKGEQVSELFDTFKIDERKLPRILNNDPIVKEIGAIVGDIIKVNRMSTTAGNIPYFRLVVEK